MNKEKVLLTYGALLHDVGKIIYRGISEKGSHSQLGAAFLEESLSGDRQLVKLISDQVSYHHAKELSSAKLKKDSFAYITYFADNISAGMDRRNEGEDSGFDRDAKLRKIFNILCGHHDDNTKPDCDYNLIREKIKIELKGNAPSEERLSSVLNLLEAVCSAVPSSTDKAQLIDVSLFDHLKTTAAIAACIYDYFNEKGVADYRAALFDASSADRYYAEEMFLLWSCDISGIQDFIYQISGTGALKQLRARSFYLEMLLEHCADELLTRLDLSRCNLLYTGGGHAYALLPNTEKAKKIIDDFAAKLKTWMIKAFGVDLYCASAYATCSANELKNVNRENSKAAAAQKDAGSYRGLFQKLGNELSLKKQKRYTACDISEFNFSKAQNFQAERECSECHRSDTKFVQGENGSCLCEFCAALKKISAALVAADVFVVSKAPPPAKDSLELPFDACLSCYTVADYKQEKPANIRVYSKNDWHTGDFLSTHIWMGDYTADQHDKGISDYAASGATLKPEKGIKRLGVLRADVDNLGQIFTNGIADEKISISRTATLSRELSYFFKYQINDILDKKGYRAQIIYSGGDDLFLIGNWNDVIEAAVDIHNALDEFTGNGVLTISAGIGMYAENYPLARMAEETGALEDCAKDYVDDCGRSKNAVALWTEDNVFSWDEFINAVVPMKKEIEAVFKDNEKGMSFVYQMLALLRTSDRIAIPRFAYLLARSFEDKKEDDVAKIRSKIYKWATEEKTKKQLLFAIQWYVYSERERS